MRPLSIHSFAWLALLAMALPRAALAADDAQTIVHDRVQAAHTQPISCPDCRYVTLVAETQQQFRMVRVGSRPTGSSREITLLVDGSGSVSQFLADPSNRRLSGWEVQAAVSTSAAKFCDFRSGGAAPLPVLYVESGLELQSINDAGVTLAQTVAPPLRQENTFYVFRDGAVVQCGTAADARIAARLVDPSPVNRASFMQTVQASVEKKLRQYLEIPLVPEPRLPDNPVLEMDEFESSEAFSKRVEEVRRTREATLFRQQQEFRRQVERRNQLIAERQATLDAHADQLTREATLQALGPVILTNAEYDPDTGRMFLDVQSTRTDFTRRMVFSVPAKNDQARNLKQRLEQAELSLALDVDRNGVAVSEATLTFDGYAYDGKAAEATEQGRVAKRIDLRTLEHDHAVAGVPAQMQSPDLVDRRSFRYDSGKVEDDVRDAVAAMPETAPDSRRWLLAVAVENYDNADRVIFAKNSGEQVVSALQKKFGIPARNTYALIDEKATAGAFQDQLATLLANIRPGDTVFFYYSGHGIPDQKSEEAYILPKDKMVGFVAQESYLRLSSIYSQLAASPAGRVYAFVDSCFSGKTDNISNFKGVAPGVFRTREFALDEQKMVVMTAGKHNQFSNAYNERGHRMFSYFLLKSLLKQRPSAAPLDVQSLYQEIAVSVRDASHAKGDAYVQEPQLLGNQQARF